MTVRCSICPTPRFKWRWRHRVWVCEWCGRMWRVKTGVFGGGDCTWVERSWVPIKKGGMP